MGNAWDICDFSSLWVLLSTNSFVKQANMVCQQAEGNYSWAIIFRICVSEFEEHVLVADKKECLEIE